MLLAGDHHTLDGSDEAKRRACDCKSAPVRRGDIAARVSLVIGWSMSIRGMLPELTGRH